MYFAVNVELLSLHYFWTLSMLMLRIFFNQIKSLSVDVFRLSSLLFYFLNERLLSLLTFSKILKHQRLVFPINKKLKLIKFPRKITFNWLRYWRRVRLCLWFEFSWTKQHAPATIHTAYTFVVWIFLNQTTRSG